MADIINLKRARKQLQRTEDEKTAANNRAKHGRTKAEKLLEKAQQQREIHKLDGHKRVDD